MLRACPRNPGNIYSSSANRRYVSVGICLIITIVRQPIRDRNFLYSAIFSFTNSGVTPSTSQNASVSNASTSRGVTIRSYEILLPTRIFPFLSLMIPLLGYIGVYTSELFSAASLYLSSMICMLNSLASNMSAAVHRPIRSLFCLFSFITVFCRLL